MIDLTETAVHVERTVDVSSGQLFTVLVDPARHAELDGSGTVRGARERAPIAAVGQVFTMQMSAPDLGDYVSENHVVEFEPGRLLTWETTRVGKPRPGFRWSWRIEPAGQGRSLVTHVYDWSRVTDQTVLDRVGFPRVSPQEMNTTLTRLAAAARR